MEEWFEPTVVPSEKPRRLMLIGAAAFLLLVVVLVIVFFVKRERAQDAVEEARQQLEATVQNAQTDCFEAQDAQACSSRVRLELAQASGNPDYCSTLTGDDLSSCLQLAALTSADASICDSIEDETKQDACLLAVVAQTPVAERSYESCELFEGNVVADCQFQWTLEHAIEGDCEASEISDALCEIGAHMAAALSSQDPDVCGPIQDETYAEICRERVGPGDRDFDGLSATREQELGTSDRSVDSDADGLADAEEIERGTDPADADSDNDGYNDGTEVQSGYDPLGSGTL